jgi:integrase
VPTFHEFAELWWLRNERRFAAKTRDDYRWRLERHLLPFFGERRLDAITFDLVERYIAAKLAEPDPLCASSINKTAALLAVVLEGAVERELIARNPAKGRARRVRERAPQRSHLDSAEQVAALLDAGGALDSHAAIDKRHVHRRAMLAVLVFAGLRIGELCALRWRDVDLAGGWLHVGEAKTDAGRRRVRIRGALRDELLAIKLGDTDPDRFVFATTKGRQTSAENIRSRTLARAAKLANEELNERGLAPLPDRLTPHSLRRTFASILYALGEDPGVCMDELGHTDPALALRVYRQSMRRDDGAKARLRALVEGRDVADSGIRGEAAPASTVERRAA